MKPAFEFDRQLGWPLYRLLGDQLCMKLFGQLGRSFRRKLEIYGLLRKQLIEKLW